MEHHTINSTFPHSSAEPAPPGSASSPAAPSPASSTTTTCTVRGPQALYSFLEQHHEKLDRQMKRLGVVQLVAGMGYFTPGQSEGGEEAQGKETAWIFARETKKVRKFAEEIFGKAGFAFEVVDPRLLPLPSVSTAPDLSPSVTPCTLHLSTAPGKWESEPLPTSTFLAHSASTHRSDITFSEKTAPICTTALKVDLPEFDPKAESPSSFLKGEIQWLSVNTYLGWSLHSLSLNFVGEHQTIRLIESDMPYRSFPLSSTHTAISESPEVTQELSLGITGNVSAGVSRKKGTEEEGQVATSDHKLYAARPLQSLPAAHGVMWFLGPQTARTISIPTHEFTLVLIPQVKQLPLSIVVTARVISRENGLDSRPYSVAYELEQKIALQLPTVSRTEFSAIAAMDHGVTEANVWPSNDSSTAHGAHIPADASSSNPPASRLSSFIQRLREALSPGEDSRRRAP